MILQKENHIAPGANMSGAVMQARQETEVFDRIEDREIVVKNFYGVEIVEIKEHHDLAFAKYGCMTMREMLVLLYLGAGVVGRYLF